MTKKELTAQVIKISGVEISQADAAKICDAFVEVIRKTVKKQKRIPVANLGIFKLSKRKARKGRNPQTGEEIKIKASKTVSFKPAAGFKGSL